MTYTSRIFLFDCYIIIFISPRCEKAKVAFNMCTLVFITNATGIDQYETLLFSILRFAYRKFDSDWKGLFICGVKWKPSHSFVRQTKLNLSNKIFVLNDWVCPVCTLMFDGASLRQEINSLISFSEGRLIVISTTLVDQFFFLFFSLEKFNGK